MWWYTHNTHTHTLALGIGPIISPSLSDSEWVGLIRSWPSSHLGDSLTWNPGGSGGPYEPLRVATFTSSGGGSVTGGGIRPLGIWGPITVLGGVLLMGSAVVGGWGQITVAPVAVSSSSSLLDC